MVSTTAPNVLKWDSAKPGSEITMTISPPIKLGSRANNTCSLVDAAIFFSSPNVGPAALSLGNSFTFTNADIANGPVATQTITLETGLYGLVDLNATLSRETLALGYGTALDPLFVLGADNGSQKIILNVSVAGITVNWSTSPNPITSMLGFDAVDLGPTVVPNEYFIAQNRADFPQGVSSYVINLDIVNGSYLGGKTGNALSTVLLNAAPNSQIILDSPSTLVEVPVQDESITSIRAWLTDQSGRRILMPEPYSFSFVVRSRRD